MLPCLPGARAQRACRNHSRFLEGRPKPPRPDVEGVASLARVGAFDQGSNAGSCSHVATNLEACATAWHGERTGLPKERPASPSLRSAQAPKGSATKADKHTTSSR